MNKCDSKFWDWFSVSYAENPEKHRLNDEEMYAIWQTCWQIAYSTGLHRGQRQGRLWGRYERKPMSYFEMEELFIGCKTGRDFGQKIEKWHGIE